ncbi:hypothetical protein [Streptomyces sp. NPDC057280]|uniref:hypothetical protein n=1 Tax=Streptomyces sp. NPDC057280 TaxID=3346081 RepID=UPI0036377975
MRRTMPVVGVLMILLGVLVAGLSMLTYADKGERILAEKRLAGPLSDQERELALGQLRGIEDRERLNISMTVGGTVFAAAGGAVLVSVRRRAAEARRG